LHGYSADAAKEFSPGTGKGRTNCIRSAGT